MVKPSLPSFWLTLLAAFACLAPLERADALTASQYFADANRLAREDLYWAALLRYSQAASGGMESPLLHYNVGVTHYRAGQHIRAREELLQALDDPSLRVVTHYNLGLNAYALGQTDEALRWFRLARDQDANSKIQQFAIIAISRIRDERKNAEVRPIRVVKLEKQRDLFDFQFHASVGYGQDDNVFRSPDRVYRDRSDPSAPVITAIAQEGTFVPIDLSAKYLVNSLKFEGFFVSYRLTGRYYTDELLRNADRYRHEAAFGSEYRRKEGNRERELRSAFKISHNDEIYYDHDDGAPREIGGVFIGDRLDYVSYGPQLAFRQSYDRLAVGAKLKGMLLNYDEQTLVPEYDHAYFELSLYGQYKFTESSLFRVGAKGYSRRYSDRPSFDLDGQQIIGTRDLRYDYYALEITARQRIFDSLWFGFDVERTERIDQYQGYNDYTRDSVSAEAHWSPGSRFNVNADASYYLYDYPNAFAFHNSTLARKTQETATAGIVATFRMTPRLSLVAEARYRETVSNDIRIQYARNQYSLGLRWQQ
jgi:hypothetical protein